MFNLIEPPRERAFSLMEILTAIVIVAVLMILGIQFTKSLSEKSKQMVCMRQLSQVYITVRLYAAENKNLYPRSFFNVPHWQNWWTECPLAPYAGGREAWETLVVCPKNRTPTPIAPTGIKGYPYTVNYNIFRASAPANVRPYDQINVLTLQNASKTILAIDSKSTNAGWGIGFNSTTSGWTRASAHHRAQANILWADGHVTNTALNEVTDEHIVLSVP